MADEERREDASHSAVVVVGGRILRECQRQAAERGAESKGLRDAV